MLNSLRQATGTWVVRILLGLLVLSFAVWGISGQIFGGPGNTVVTAGSTSVSTVEYRLAYDRQIAILSQQFGTRITREQAQAFGVDSQVLAQLVAGAVLDEQARKMGLGLSRDRLALLTAQDPAFAGPDGQFNRQQFDFVLSQVGMRAEDYLRSREQVAIRQQIVEAVSDGMEAPEAFLRAVSLYQGEDRTAEYIVLPRASLEPVEDPSDSLLATYFEENASTYAAPEYRRIVYVKLEPEDIADPASVSDEEVRADYEANLNLYTTPERRRIEQIVFSDRAAAEAARDAIQSGSTFEDIVAAQGRTLSDVALGTFARSEVADAAVAEAAFALSQNEVSAVVDGAFGAILLRVTEITPEIVRPFEEVAAEIRNEIALGEASRVLMSVRDSYEDARAGGDSLQEAAERLDLDIVTVEAVDRSARTPDDTVLSDLPESQTLLAEAFDTEAGIENPAIPIGSNGYVFYEVEEVIAARARTLDEVRDRVAADWRDRETATRLAAQAREIEQRLRDGTSLDDVAAELGLEKQIKRGLRRQSSDADFGRPGVAAVFGVAQGGTGVVEAPSGDAQIVFVVTEVFEPAAAGAGSLAPEMRDNFAAGMADDLLDQLVARLQGEYEITVNRAAIEQAMSF